ncbi:MAG: hypothetical protein K8S23_11360 [Candidatus Cloacimonetes bacterium]|nr:hypothetical protein [Candidatus Cloacimonadota bacterium]
MKTKTFGFFKKLAWVLFFLLILYTPLNMYKSIKENFTRLRLPFHVSLNSYDYKLGEIIYSDSLLIDTALDKKILIKLDTLNIPLSKLSGLNFSEESSFRTKLVNYVKDKDSVTVYYKDFSDNHIKHKTVGTVNLSSGDSAYWVAIFVGLVLYFFHFLSLISY